MNQQIAFLINPLKKNVAIADYFSWVIEMVKVKNQTGKFSFLQKNGQQIYVILIKFGSWVAMALLIIL
jgi:hypothetical protein